MAKKSCGKRIVIHVEKEEHGGSSCHHPISYCVKKNWPRPSLPGQEWSYTRSADQSVTTPQEEKPRTIGSGHSGLRAAFQFQGFFRHSKKQVIIPAMRSSPEDGAVKQSGPLGCEEMSER